MLLRVLTILCGVLLAWATFLGLTGGFYTRIGSLRISSRNPVTPIALAALCAIAIAWLVRMRGVPRPIAAARGRLRSEWPRLKARLRDWLESSAGLASVCVLVAVVAAGYFFHWAGDAPLWLDEQMIALNIRDRSASELVGALWFGQAAPYGWLLAERTTLVLFGPQGVNLRFLPVLFGIGSVVVAAWIGRRWLTTVAALLLVALGGFSLWLAHYTFELKHYSADRFTSLLLPALVAWTLDAADRPTFLRRAGIWWLVAAVAQWVALGATLVTPGCVAVLLLFAWRRYGARAMLGAASAAWVWAVAFALHYGIALRYTHHSEFLRDYWASRLPPAAVGVGGVLLWLRDQLQPLAMNPGGTQLWVAFWSVGLGGLLFGSRRTLGLSFLPVPVSALLFAAAGQVPLYDRFSLWMVPSLHVGIALAADRAVRWILAWRERGWLQLAAATAVLAVITPLGYDTITRGWRMVLSPRAHVQNHGMNDREAVLFVKAHLRPVDVILTTRHGWPAIWWYGEISSRDGADDPIQHGGIGDGGSGIGFLTIARVDHDGECDRAPLAAALAPYRRAIVFLSFPDESEGFVELAIRRLSVFGRVITINDFTSQTRVAIIDLQTPHTIDSALALDADLAARRTPNTPKTADGCVAGAPVRRW